jgi:hypothetical protein
MGYKVILHLEPTGNRQIFYERNEDFAKDTAATIIANDLLFSGWTKEGQEIIDLLNADCVNDAYSCALAKLANADELTYTCEIMEEKRK